MQVLQIIFFSLGIIALCVYLYKASTAPVKPTDASQKASKEIPYEIEPGRWSDKWYVGPAPTESENRDFSAWITQFFKEFPESGLKNDYPKEYKMARALLIIDRINLQLQRGEITKEQYDAEYESASELIDISEDLV